MTSKLDGMRFFFQKIYFWMFLGLLLSALSALLVVSIPSLLFVILGTPLFFVLIIGELGLVVVIGMFFKRISETTAKILFVIYSFLNGLTLSVVLLAYTLESVVFTFVLVAVMFGILSLYGFFTKADLSKLGPVLFAALIALIIALVVNLFLRNSNLGLFISIAGVVIFTILIAYDTHILKKFYVLAYRDKKLLSKFVVLGALKLYLDFINLFLFLLRLLGKRK